MSTTLVVVRPASYDQEVQSSDSVERQIGMQIAFAAMPIESGVYSHFCTLRDGLDGGVMEVVGVSGGCRTAGELDA